MNNYWSEGMLQDIPSGAYDKPPSLIIAIFGSYINFAIFLILLYFIFRAIRSRGLINRVQGCKSIFLKGGYISAATLFENIRNNIDAQGFKGITFNYKTLPDKITPSNSRKYLVVTYRKMSWYISTFPVANDYIISYWRVAEVNRILSVINLIPVYGPQIVDILRTPTLYTADINNATDMMISDEIQTAIDELTLEVSEKRETSHEFKTFLQALKRGK